MNIKSLSGLGYQPIVTEKISEKSEGIKAHDTTDRDADGRQQQTDKRRLVTEEELKKILESLKANPGVVSHNLSVQLIIENDIQVILITTPEGEVVRRIPQDVFYQLFDSIDLANGRILNKAA